jgi:RHS repeat-associated protein
MGCTSNFLFSSDYKPFGLNYLKNGASFFQYTGKPVDPSTGLYYFGARFYDPAIERFITEDTYSGVKEDPQSLNRYAYVENKLLSNTDLSYFGLIKPCGLDPDMITSMKQTLGREVELEAVKTEVVSRFAEVFGYDLPQTPSTRLPPPQA